MKLVRISEDIVLDIDDIQCAVWNHNDQEVKISFKSNDAWIGTGDKKVLDAICGSEEHLIECEDAEKYRRDRKTIKNPYSSEQFLVNTIKNSRNI